MEKNKFQKGYTLVEVAVAIGVFIFLALIIAQVYFLIVKNITAYREQNIISTLADQYMEIAKNVSYNQLGTVSGNPSGSLPDSASPISTTVNGVDYQIYYKITYIDNPANGTANGTGPFPQAYKQVKVYIKNTRTNFLNTFVTNISA